MKNIICFILAIFLLSSCSDYLDVQPVEKLVPETIDHFDRLLKDRNGHILRGYQIYMDDDITLPTAAANLPSNFSNAFYWGEFIEDDVLTEEHGYKHPYFSILVANTVLENIASAKGDDEDYRQAVRGKALISRAAAYIHLVNLYSKHYNQETAAIDLGVQLILKVDLEDQAPRATVQAVYDQIINDLLEGAEIVDDMSPNFPANNYEPSKAVAYAYLSRVYLYMENWEKSIEFGEKAMELHNGVNNYNVAAEIPTSTKKANTNKEILLRRINDFVSYFIGAAYLSDDLISYFDLDKDLRIKSFTTTNPNGITFGKGYVANSRMVQGGIQTPEIILNTAESYARSGRKEEAMAHLSYLRKHRYDRSKFVDDTAFDTYVNLTATDDADALNKVLAERRREFMFNGLRWFDMKRFIVLGEYNNTVVRDLGGESQTELAPDSPRYLLAIPLREIDLNPNLVQNPR